MFLAIDIGNTHTVIGLYAESSLVTSCRLTSSIHRTMDNILVKIISLHKESGIDKKEIDGIGISSVVPHLTNAYSALVKKYFHKKALVISADLKIGINIYYDDPTTLGADRICNTIAGYAKYGGPLIIIDFGTATTYDIVASNGDYVGGVIAPGIATSAISLHRRTAKLPQLTENILQLPENIICTNTIDSMQAGILWGAVDSMAAMVGRIQEELQKRYSKKAIVIATGGFSTFIAEHSRIIQHTEPTLVLDGIQMIYRRVNG